MDAKHGCSQVREERRLRASENQVLRRIIFGAKWDEVNEEQRRLHNEQLNDLYSSPNINLGNQINDNDFVEHVACTGGRRGAYRVLMGRYVRNRALIATNSVHPPYAQESSLKGFYFTSLFVCLMSLARQPPVGQGLIIHEFSRSHTTTQHSR